LFLNTKYRWVLVNNLIVKNESRIPPNVPIYSFDEINDELHRLVDNNCTDYLYQNDTRNMKIRQIQDIDDEFLCLLVSTGDKNAPDVMYENFNNSGIRTFIKEEDEGAIVSSHVLIKKDPGKYDNHLMLIERVPGITISQIQRYLRYLFRQGNNKTYVNDDGIDVEYRPLFEIVGYPSNTLREAIKDNTLQDIEFVKHSRRDDGIDEYGYVQEEVTRVKLVVKRGIETSTEDEFFQNLMNKFRTGNFEQMHVRIKTRNNQTKTTEVNTNLDDEDILSQFFICNEVVNNFEKPLENACLSIRNDMIPKLLVVASKYEN